MEIQPVDLFVQLRAALQEASDKIEESARNGGYEGTEEEIREMMEYDYLFQAYGILEEAYLNMQYQEPETVLVEVSAEKGSTNSPSAEKNTMRYWNGFSVWMKLQAKGRQKPGLLRKTAKISGKVKVGLEISAENMLYSYNQCNVDKSADFSHIR